MSREQPKSDSQNSTGVTPHGAELERQLHSRQPTLVEEFWHFLRHNKKWWLLPILLALLVLGTLVVLSGTALAPFMYPF